MADSDTDRNLREEFNRWADSGKGETMEHEHWPIAKPAVGLMQLTGNENILDVGCGAGWLSRILAKRVPQGRVVGMEISDEMIRHARQAGAGFVNLGFVVGGVGDIPWEPDFFTRAISVESSYYWPDPEQGLREIFRVTAPGGSAWNLINYYTDNPYCHQWGKILAVPTRLLSIAEWENLFRAAGFAKVAHFQLPDPTPNPEVYNGRWFHDAGELAAFRAIGALLVQGTKPSASL
jgi:ubiquinone/menaquinone biosynthesis C-methylase UbiE